MDEAQGTLSLWCLVHWQGSTDQQAVGSRAQGRQAELGCLLDSLPVGGREGTRWRGDLTDKGCALPSWDTASLGHPAWRAWGELTDFSPFPAFDLSRLSVGQNRKAARAQGRRSLQDLWQGWPAPDTARGGSGWERSWRNKGRTAGGASLPGQVAQLHHLLPGHP